MGRFPCISGRIAALRLPVTRPRQPSFPRRAVPALGRKPRGLPGSWGSLLCARPALGPRWTFMPSPCAQSRSCMSGIACCHCKSIGSTTIFRGSITRLSHNAVYASQPGSPLDHARLASGWGPALTGWTARSSRPLGPNTRFRLSSWLPPHPGFSWRTAMPCWVVSGSESQTHRSKYGVPLEAWGADPPLRGAPTWGRFSWRRPPGPVAPDRSLLPRTGGTGTAPAARRAPSPRQETELATSTAWAVVPHSQFPEVSRANSASVDAMVPRGCRRSTGVFMKSAGAGATSLGGGWNGVEPPGGGVQRWSTRSRVVRNAR